MNQEQYDYEVMRELELRDYFAARAMSSLIINHIEYEKHGLSQDPNYPFNGTAIDPYLLAVDSYEMADAMMEARKNG